MLRIDPVTGAAASGNPFSASADLNKRKVIAYGLRNPFRFTFRPGTSDIWLGDVGWTQIEEIDKVTPGAPAENFGWPCKEGNAGQRPVPEPDVVRLVEQRGRRRSSPTTTATLSCRATTACRTRAR